MKKILAAAILIPLLLVSLIAWPMIYNYYIFSLARLKNGIEVGDSYQDVLEKFKEYEAKYQSDDELEAVYESTELFIYHVNMFDDCQLTVLFDTVNGKVREVRYIGD